MTKNYKKYFNLKTIIVLVLLLLPLIFIWFLKKKNTGTIDGWLGFFGGYFGVLGAIGTVWLQSYEEKNKKAENTKLYVNFILDYNLKRTDNNIQSELINLFTVETKIDTISNQHNYFLNFDEEEIKNNISTYIELKIIEQIYKIISSINCFSKHYNYYFKNCNDFHSHFASLKEKLKFNNDILEKKFDLIYDNIKKLSKINYYYSSLIISKHNLLFLKHLEKDIKKNYEDLKTFSSYYEYQKINDVFFILNGLNKEISTNGVANITLDSNTLSCLFEAYKESLEILLLFLDDNKLLDLKDFRKYELMLFSINIAYSTFHSLKKEMEKLKKSL